MGKKRQKVVLPPELPPEPDEKEIEPSDEDLKFVTENLAYAGYISNLDTDLLNKHVRRVADGQKVDLEAEYEARVRKKHSDKEIDENIVEVDALPVKTASGQLYYKAELKETSKAENESKEKEATGEDVGVVKLTKAEKRVKLKKLRKEAKKQAKEELQQIPQAEVLDEVKKDLTAEEADGNKKYKLAELGTNLLADPESNIKSLREMLQISKDRNWAIVTLGLKSLLAVFKDIIPGYRIRLPTEKELEMKVSKEVKKMRLYESTLLSAYKAYVHRLIALEQQAVYQRVAVRCICTLLDAVPHFNFRENLLAAVVRNISSPDDIIRNLCCATIKSLFMNEGKHGGEATVEAVQMIAELVKTHNCQLHPDSLQVFMSLSFDEDIGKSVVSNVDNKYKNKNSKKRKGFDEPNHLSNNEKKKSKQEMMTKTREEVNADFKAASLAKDLSERRRMQSQILSAVFETFFRVLKHTMLPLSEAKSVLSASGGHPLLAPCLNGIGKFSHLIDLDFMADLMNCLRRLVGNGSKSEVSTENSSNYLTVSERLLCCIIAFKVMRNNLDALNVDLQDFVVQFYNLILEYRPGRDPGEVFAEALKIMLCDDRQHDMQRAAAFIKRLATFSLCFGSSESMAALVTVKHLLQKNAKCRNLLENDAGGGSVAGAIVKYQPYASDPNLSGALASVLWELNLLTKHYHPAISTMASGIATMGTATNNQVYHAIISPLQAFKELSLEQESFVPPVDTKRTNSKRKRGIELSSAKVGKNINLEDQVDENEVRKKLTDHFLLLRDIAENEKLRSELNRTNQSMNLYELYKKQKRKRGS